VDVTSRVERATPADLGALGALRVAEGWLASETLLEAVQAWERGRLFVVREERAATGGPALPVATTSAIAAGAVGVIGNVIVRADSRRRGLGLTLMEAALAWLRRRGVRRVLLDATADGRPLYARLGFVPVAPSWFGHAHIASIDRAALAARAGGMRAEARGVGALGGLAGVDRAAFGGDRLGLLELLLRRAPGWLYVAEGGEGMPAGYLLVRPLEAPYAGIRLGPWIAKTPEAAAATLVAALADDAPWRADVAAGAGVRPAEAYLSLPGTSQEALALLAAASFTLAEDDVVMQLTFAEGGPPDGIAPAGGPPLPAAEHPSWLYTWLAPMVF